MTTQAILTAEEHNLSRHSIRAKQLSEKIAEIRGKPVNLAEHLHHIELLLRSQI